MTCLEELGPTPERHVAHEVVASISGVSTNFKFVTERKK